jgi:hypothetical protein
LDIRCSLSNVLKNEIYSISVCKKKKQIYVCLLNEKKILIFDYNLKENTIKLNDNNIIDERSLFDSKGFNKCISISNNYLATADNCSIIIWKNELNNKDKYSRYKTISINEIISDILVINEDYFISARPRSRLITFYNINNLKEEKIISNIQIINNVNCLLLFKDYCIINCVGGLSLILNSTKEYVQFINIKDGDNFDSYYKRCITCDDYIYTINSRLKAKDNYYIRSLILKINGFQIKEECLEQCKYFKEVEIEIRDDISINNDFDILCLNNKCFLLSNSNEIMLSLRDNKVEELAPCYSEKNIN